LTGDQRSERKTPKGKKKKKRCVLPAVDCGDERRERYDNNSLLCIGAWGLVSPQIHQYIPPHGAFHIIIKAHVEALHTLLSHHHHRTNEKKRSKNLSFLIISASGLGSHPCLNLPN